MANSSICLCTLYTEEIASYGILTARNKQNYCKKHGYNFLCRNQPLDASRPPSWSKILLIKEALKENKWVFWSDADAVICNYDIGIEQFVDENYNIMICREECGGSSIAFNAGNFIVKHAKWSFKILDEVYSRTEFVNHKWWEQAAMWYLYSNSESMRKCVKILPHRAFNSYRCNYQKGDFMVHYPGVKEHLRLQMIRQACFDAGLDL